MGFFIPGTTDPVRQYYLGDHSIAFNAFIDELDAHGGLLGQHFSWCDCDLEYDGVMYQARLEFFEDTPDAVIDAVVAVYEAHIPVTVVI